MQKKSINAMNKKLILIAEDEVAYGKILKNTLEKEGYDVAVAVNGDEVLKLARARKPVLVILDLIMPMKNGFEVLAEMKKDEKLKGINVIALSNLGQEEDVEKAKKLGADDYIIKSDETFYNVIQKIKKQLK
jgi:DNA-binding response OmpR family regulator